MKLGPSLCLQITGQDLDGDGKVGGKKHHYGYGMNPAMMGMGAAGAYGAGGAPPVVNALEQVCVHLFHAHTHTLSLSLSRSLSE